MIEIGKYSIGNKVYMPMSIAEKSESVIGSKYELKINTNGVPTNIEKNIVEDLKI